MSAETYHLSLWTKAPKNSIKVIATQDFKYQEGPLILTCRKGSKLFISLNENEKLPPFLREVSI